MARKVSGRRRCRHTHRGHEVTRTVRLASPSPAPRSAWEPLFTVLIPQSRDIDHEWVQTLEYNSVIIRKKTHVKTPVAFPTSQVKMPHDLWCGFFPDAALDNHNTWSHSPSWEFRWRRHYLITLERGSWKEKVGTKGDWGKKTTQSTHLSTYYVQSFVFPIACIIIRCAYILYFYLLVLCSVCLPLPDTKI